MIFHTADRAPAEGYMSQNYASYVIFSYDTHYSANGGEFSTIHTDRLFAPYALNWVTMHEVENEEVNSHLTGGNYVDISLRVVVKCATDTIMVSQFIHTYSSHDFSYFILDYVS